MLWSLAHARTVSPLCGLQLSSTKLQPDLGRVEAADVATEGEELNAPLARLDVPVEAIGTDVVGRDQVPDAVRAGVGRADPFGLGAWRPVLAAGLGLEGERPELVEADHHRRARLGERVELDDPVALGLKIGVVGALPGSHRLKADALL